MDGHLALCGRTVPLPLPESELRQLAEPIATTAAEARESHVLFNNCYSDYAVRNAAQLRDLIQSQVSA